MKPLGKRWRWKDGCGYVVQQVIGDPDMVRKYPDWEVLHVGLKRHEAVEDPKWQYDYKRVDPGWGDYDVEANRLVHHTWSHRARWMAPHGIE